jgi:hypothetical protein
MRTATAVILWIVRVAGVLQLLSGALFWAGRGTDYVPLHVVVGVSIVLALWTLAVFAFVARTRPGLAVFALIWGLVLPAFGIRQAAILIGPMHWIVRVVHLLMGLFAIGMAIPLARAILAAAPGAVQRPEREHGGVAASRVR